MHCGRKQLHLWIRLKQLFQKDGRAIVTSAGVAGCVIALRLAGWLQALEWAGFDQFFQLRPLEPVDERVVIVGIGEEDLQTVGKFPIPDTVLTKLLQKVQSYQPRAIGLDIYRDLPVEPGHQALLKLYQSMPHLIGIQQFRDKTSSEVPGPPVLADRGQIGFNNLVYDLDNKVRRGLLYWTIGEKPHQSFALMLALRYLEREGITPQAAMGEPYLQLGKGVFRPFQGNDGAYSQADDGGYQILANLRGPANTFRIVSLMDVLQDRVPPQMLRDRVVLIGSTAVSLKDFFHTSYSKKLVGAPRPTSGVELQANLVSQILSSALDGRTLIQVWAEPIEWIWIFVWSCLGAWICWRLQFLQKSVLIILLSGGTLTSLCYWAFLAGWWLPLVPALLALNGSAIAVIAHIAHLRQELQRSKEFLNTIINTIPDPIFVKDQQHRWIVLNQAYCRFSGYSLEGLLNRSDYEVFPAQEAHVFRQQDQWVFTTGQERENEEDFTDRAGVTHQIATKRSLHRDAAGNVFLVGVIRDITERKRMEEELKRTAAELVRSNAELQQSASLALHLATHDSLTGLPNRKLFCDRLEQALEWAAQNEQLVALLFLDLDGFKLINDTQGHDVGDQLLKAVARRLTGCLRGSDTVARLGGDEFTIILPAVPSTEVVAKVAEKILDTLSKPFQLNSHTIFVTSSIGISIYPNNGNDIDAVVKGADTAMYRAKELGKNRYEFVVQVMGDGSSVMSMGTGPSV
jgi:diguanylate cyclase (GGDEF)-like protein/PAS domain S-box-containing protein